MNGILSTHSKVPLTRGIKYAGSKLKLLPQILSLIEKAGPGTVFDGFSGTTRVAQALDRRGYRVIANDLAIWSEVFGRCYLLNPHPPEHYQEMVDHLNALPGVEGWFTEHYGGDGGDVQSVGKDGNKKPWQRHNTLRLDAIRLEIDRIAPAEPERSVLLASLMLALDEVENTLGHFVSYLNQWSPRSYRPMELKVPVGSPSQGNHEVWRGDIFDRLAEVNADLAYYDPPYGSNNDKMPPSRVRYGAYYHLWTTICLNDRPDLFGKANRRVDSSDGRHPSLFEDFRKDSQGRFVAVSAIHRLLKESPVPWILLSYSSGGRATFRQLQECIEDVGTLKEVMKVSYRKNVMAGMRWTHRWVEAESLPNQEYLFLICKE